MTLRPRCRKCKSWTVLRDFDPLTGLIDIYCAVCGNRNPGGAGLTMDEKEGTMAKAVGNQIVKQNRTVAPCAECAKTSAIAGRGLCGACYQRRKALGRELPPKVRKAAPAATAVPPESVAAAKSRPRPPRRPDPQPTPNSGVPQVPGLYLAKHHGLGEDLIVAVEGSAPMLYIAWALLRGINGPRLIAAMKPFEIKTWGQQLLDSEVRPA